jgi:acetyl esterase/lipase
MRFAFLICLCALALTGCRSSEPAMAPMPSNPNAQTGPAVVVDDPMNVTSDHMGTPSWAPNIDPQMHAVIEQLVAFEQPGFAEMTPFQARMAKTPTEAVQALLMKVGHGPMPPKTDIAHKVLPVGPDEGILVRTYTPLEGTNGNRPVVVYFHGGGWVIAGLDTYEASAAALAARTGAIVVSVAYRMAPEHRFPTAHMDAMDAYTWVVQNAAQMGGDPSRVAVAGESAGGNLAVAVALMARERGVQMPAHILSVYPIADQDVQSPSYDEYADALPLSRPAMEWFFDTYAPDWRTNTHAYIDLTSQNFQNFPPTTILNAQIDPLASEGMELAERMRADGVDVQHEEYQSVTHEFFGMAVFLEQAVAAQQLAADRLRASLMR